MSEEEAPIVVQEADAVYEAVRTVCHHSETQPAPTVYRVLGNIKGAAGPALAQALEQLAAGLERSLTEYDVHEDDGRIRRDSSSPHASRRRSRRPDRRAPLRRAADHRRTGLPSTRRLTERSPRQPI